MLLIHKTNRVQKEEKLQGNKVYVSRYILLYTFYLSIALVFFYYYYYHYYFYKYLLYFILFFGGVYMEMYKNI